MQVQAARVQAQAARVQAQAVTAEAVRAQAGTAEAVTAGAGQGNRPLVFSRPFVQETKVMAATGRVIPIV